MSNIKTVLYSLLAFAYLTICCNAACPSGTVPASPANINSSMSTYGATGFASVSGSISDACFGFTTGTPSCTGCQNGPLIFTPSAGVVSTCGSSILIGAINTAIYSINTALAFLGFGLNYFPTPATACGHINLGTVVFLCCGCDV
jgi:hypothetical protein